jgi:hypothetical protein
MYDFIHMNIQKRQLCGDRKQTSRLGPGEGEWEAMARGGQESTGVKKMF